MSAVDTTASRFLRPPDVGASAPQSAAAFRSQRLLHRLRNVALARRRHRRRRLDLAAHAVRRALRREARSRSPAPCTRRARRSIASRSATSALNLFQIDIARVQRDLGGARMGAAASTSRRSCRTRCASTITERDAGGAGAQRRAASLYVDEDGVGVRGALADGRRRRSAAHHATPIGAELVRTRRRCCAICARAIRAALLAHLRGAADPAARLRHVRPRARRGRLRQRRRRLGEVAEPLSIVEAEHLGAHDRVRRPPFRGPHHRQTRSSDHDRAAAPFDGAGRGDHELGDDAMPRTEDKYIVALDIGTSKVCVLVGEINDRGQLEIIGKGTSPMKGTRRGNIINLDQAIDAVKKAVDEAEVMAGLQIESVYVGDRRRSHPLGQLARRRLGDGQAQGDRARRHRPRHRSVEVDQHPGRARAAARHSARVRRRRPGRHPRSARHDRARGSRPTCTSSPARARTTRTSSPA